MQTDPTSPPTLNYASKKPPNIPLRLALAASLLAVAALLSPELWPLDNYWIIGTAPYGTTPSLFVPALLKAISSTLVVVAIYLLSTTALTRSRGRWVILFTLIAGLELAGYLAAKILEAIAIRNYSSGHFGAVTGPVFPLLDFVFLTYNLRAFLQLLLLVGAVFFFDKLRTRPGLKAVARTGAVACTLTTSLAFIVFLLGLPIFWDAYVGTSFSLYRSHAFVLTTSLYNSIQFITWPLIAILALIAARRPSAAI